jgi:ATP-dependent DNA helicase RecG
VHADGQLSKAGLLALGSYPQQYFPRYVVNVAQLRGASTERFRNNATFTGSIPVMLSQTLKWLQANLDTRGVTTPAGAVIDRPEYPLVALRELIANALVHRDLSAWSQGRAAELRLMRDRLELSNPGGLYGVTVDRLGAVPFTNARNQLLLSLCVNVTESDGARVVESLATGLTTVARELATDGLPPARYFDTGIAFTVVLTAPTLAPTPKTVHATTTIPVPSIAVGSALTGAAPRDLPTAGTVQRLVYDELLARPRQSTSELASALGLTPSSVRSALTTLRSPRWRLVTAFGGRGRATTYSTIVDEKSGSG